MHPTKYKANFIPHYAPKSSPKLNRRLRKFFLALLTVVVLIFALVVAGMFLPAHHIVSNTALYKAPIDTLWAVITDPVHYADWRPEVSEVSMINTSWPISWVEKNRFGKNRIYQVTESFPKLRYRTRIADNRSPVQGSWVFELTPQKDGCLLKITEEGSVLNPAMRFILTVFLRKTGTIDRYLQALSRRVNPEPTIPVGAVREPPVCIPTLPASP